MLAESKLPLSFWGEALQTYNLVLNQSPTLSIEGSTTPWQLWTDYKPDVSRLRVFGCRAWVHVQDNQRQSLQPKSILASS